MYILHEHSLSVFCCSVTWHLADYTDSNQLVEAKLPNRKIPLWNQSLKATIYDWPVNKTSGKRQCKAYSKRLLWNIMSFSLWAWNVSIYVFLSSPSLVFQRDVFREGLRALKGHRWAFRPGGRKWKQPCTTNSNWHNDRRTVQPNGSPSPKRRWDSRLVFFVFFI